jgi:hypothetical protein
MAESLSLLILFTLVRQRMRGFNNNDVEQITGHVLAECPNLNRIILDAPLNGRVEERAFIKVLSADCIRNIDIEDTMEGSSVEDILQKAIPALSKLSTISIDFAMTEPQAERIFAILSTSPSLQMVSVVLKSWNEGMAKPFSEFLRKSTSLDGIILSYDGHSHGTTTLLFDGIGESTSLQGILLNDLPTDDAHANAAAEALARAIAKSSSLENVIVPLRHRPFLGKVRDALTVKSAPSVQAFDLCFNPFLPKPTRDLSPKLHQRTPAPDL